MSNPQLDPDMVELMEALDDINEVMKGHPKEYATTLAVALRDWICDRYANDDLGFEIMREVGRAHKPKSKS